MTAKELTQQLDGREYGGEIYPEEVKTAKESGLVVVYGHSDDTVEFRGAIDDEVGCTPSAIWQWRRKNGLPKNTERGRQW